jgi:DNA invertase Pin-like site-specific DNA recombinase
MSTEHQKYSTENQAAVIGQYAEQRGISVIRTYADDGKSGLVLGGRNSLKQLIEDVQNGRADFSRILVYDISRWGRLHTNGILATRGLRNFQKKQKSSGKHTRMFAPGSSLNTRN